MLAIWMVLTLIIGAVTAAVLRGLVLAQLWKWFVVPAFGLPQISIPLAIGLSVILNYFLVNREEFLAKNKEEGRAGDPPDLSSAVPLILTEMLTAFFVLLGGWIISLFL